MPSPVPRPAARGPRPPSSRVPRPAASAAKKNYTIPSCYVLILAICLIFAKRLSPAHPRPHTELLYGRVGLRFPEPCAERWVMLSSFSCLQVLACMLRGQTCASGCMRFRTAHVVWRMVFEVLICMLLQATGPFGKTLLQPSMLHYSGADYGHTWVVSPWLWPQGSGENPIFELFALSINVCGKHTSAG